MNSILLLELVNWVKKRPPGNLRTNDEETKLENVVRSFQSLDFKNSGTAQNSNFSTENAMSGVT